MHWGKGILFTIVLFMTIFLTIAVVLMNTDVDLVEKDYYEKEINYQNRIEKERNLILFDKEIEIVYTDSKVKVIFPEELDKRRLTGEIHFYYPALAKKDFKIQFNKKEYAELIISNTLLTEGYWKLKMDFSCNEKSYYTEKTITINKS